MTDGPSEPDDMTVESGGVADTADVDGESGEHGPASEGDGTDAAAQTTAVGAPSASDLLEREGEVAADYLEALLDIVDADGDIDMDVEGSRAVVSIIGDRLRHLVGPRGAVLEALQDLTRLAVAQETGVRSRLMLDIGGYRARRRAELTNIGTQAAQRAAETGAPVTLDPMTAFERKVVHDAVAAAGQTSESEGLEPQRRVVVLPAGDPSSAHLDGDESSGQDSAMREPASPDL